MTIPVGLLWEIGRSLYGTAWQEHMAIALRISERNLRRMALGQVPIPDTLRGDLARLIEGHGEDLDGLLVLLKGEPNG